MLQPNNDTLCLIICVFLLSLTCSESQAEATTEEDPYYGLNLGPWKPLVDGSNVTCGLEGQLYAISKDEIFIKGFKYLASDSCVSWFRTAKRDEPGISDTPDDKGTRVPYPTGFNFNPKYSPELKNYTEGRDIILKLPYFIADIQWFEVFNEKENISCGHILIPKNFEPPGPVKLPSTFIQRKHGVKSGTIEIIDHRTIYIQGLHYDGKGPDAFFLAGLINGSDKPNKNGIKVPNQLGQIKKLPKYSGHGVTLRLPEKYSIDKIKWLSIFSISATANESFGDVKIPRGLNVPPRMSRAQTTDNCMHVIEDKIQLEWVTVEKQGRIYFKLSAAIEDTQWAGVGFKEESKESTMIESDAFIVYQLPHHERRFHAEDYYISGYKQCTKGEGVCPDSEIKGPNGGEDNVAVIDNHNSRADGVTLVTFWRPLVTNDTYDVALNQTVKVFGAIGQINQRSMDIGLSYQQILGHDGHDRSKPEDFKVVNFMDEDANQSCSTTLRAHLAHRAKNDVKPVPFKKHCINGRKEFNMEIGPTGGEKGYEAITGLPAWGFVMWVNGKLAPELCLRVGETYTFRIFTGTNSRGNGMNFHPVYITDDKVGGYLKKNKNERAKEKIYVGVDISNPDHPVPTWTGQYCEWMSKQGEEEKKDTAKDFCEFKKSLERRCDPIDTTHKKKTWTVPEKGLPKLLYYQCFSHKHFGWKIHIIQKGEKCPCVNKSSSMMRMSHSLFKIVVAFLLLKAVEL